MPNQTPLTIFYSWQSDLPRDTNQKAIRSCIQSALVAIEEGTENRLVMEEATSNEAGSPDIPSTIFNKISLADIFICDITTINSNENPKRKTPNPNVLIELGFAISALGWERILMVFNNNFGNFSSDLPFDLEKRRIIQCSIDNKTDNNGKKDLTNNIKSKIEQIIIKTPSKPTDVNLKGVDQIKRNKDVANLKMLMSTINIPSFDQFLSHLPDKIIDRIFFFWYSFQGYYDSNTLHIYDVSLREKLENFRICWEHTLNFGHLFKPSRDGKNYILHMPMDYFTDEKSESDYNELRGESIRLNRIFKDLIIYIRENYLEVEINELSENALRHYIDHEKETLEKLENSGE